MFKRRNFLLFSTLLGVAPYLQAKDTSPSKQQLNSVKKTIVAVQAHLFPKNSALPSANSMNISTFLFDTISHPSYDKELRVFVIEGAEELDKREKGLFTLLTSSQKEKALRSYEQTNYGSSWLSRIITLSMEGYFSDPIYGSNIKQGAWQSIKSYGGFPRPKTRYLV